MKPMIRFNCDGQPWFTKQVQEEITEAFDDFFGSWPIHYFIEEMRQDCPNSYKMDYRLNKGENGLGWAFLRHVESRVTKPWKFILRRKDFIVDVDWSPS